jgi:transcriptional regulator with GAF, ATPase, and Fis domain
MITNSVLPAGLVAESMRLAVSLGSAEDSLQTVIALALQIAPCDQASIMMLGEHRTLQTVTSSSDRAIKADRLQHELNEGPSLDAAWSDEVILIEDLAIDRRWPRWAPLAAGSGIRSVATAQLRTDIALGALSLYSEQPGGYREFGTEAVSLIAAHVSVVVGCVRTKRHLWRAIETRNLIGQAQGMLMARHGVSADQAFAVLRRYSQDSNTRITVLAEELTGTGHLPGLERAINEILARSREQ